MDHPQDDRAFHNSLPTNTHEAVLDVESIHQTIQQALRNKFNTTGGELLKQTLLATKHAQANNSDSSVYTGLSGISLLLLRLYKLTGNVEHLQTAHELISAATSNLRGRYKDCTFLCGDSGPLAIAAVTSHLMGQTSHKARDECVARVLSIAPDVCKSSSLPNEMLYGRAGYLYCLLFLQRELGDQTVPVKIITDVAQSIIRCGLRLSQTLGTACPLMYSWYHDFYTGAAHGHAGILYLLIKVACSIVQSGTVSDHSISSKCPLTYTWHDKHYFGGAHGYAGILYTLIKVADKYPDQVAYDDVVMATVDYMIGLKFPSGNYPSSFESSERDRLVHWCHGAPGFIYMFAAAYERYKKDAYRQAALGCADVVWQRGLLKKGYGLCHGVAGNGYSFLCAYRLSGDIKYLNYACQFAQWCCDYGKHGCRVADRPFSLFEGMSGTAYFLFDIASPQDARFPAFEL